MKLEQAIENATQSIQTLTLLRRAARECLNHRMQITMTEILAEPESSHFKTSDPLAATDEPAKEADGVKEKQATKQGRIVELMLERSAIPTPEPLPVEIEMRLRLIGDPVPSWIAVPQALAMTSASDAEDVRKAAESWLADLSEELGVKFVAKWKDNNGG